MQTGQKTATLKTASAVNTRLVPAMLALLLGVFVVVGAGFAGSDIIHNAAHDGRHSFSFPCH